MIDSLSTQTLAQSALDPKIWGYFALLFVVLGVGTIAIYGIRRKFLSQDQYNPDAPGGGLLEHLDEMLKAGKITKEEYEMTRKSIIDKAIEQMHTPPSDPADTP